jgi:hypothetical protein
MDAIKIYFDSHRFFQFSFGLYSVYLFIAHIFFIQELQFSNFFIENFGRIGGLIFFSFGFSLAVAFLFKPLSYKIGFFLFLILILYPKVHPSGNWVAFPALPISLASFQLISYLRNHNSSHELIKWMRFALATNLGTMYFVSGLDKITAHQWSSGKALELLYSNHKQLFRGCDLVEFLFTNSWFTELLTYATCLIEMVGILLIFKRLRMLILFSLLSLHVGMSLFLKLFELGMPFFILLIWFILLENESRVRA